jgi:hypothetical protein
MVTADQTTSAITPEQVNVLKTELVKLKKLKQWAQQLIREANAFLVDFQDLKTLEQMFE